MMSSLKRRIVAMGPDLSVVGMEEGPDMIVTDTVMLGSYSSGYSSTALVDPHGMPIPATAAGQWGQVRAAGKP